MTATVPAVYAAINAVMAAIGKTGISKDRKNAQQGYNFRGIDDVYNELNGLLSTHKLLMLPTLVSSEQVERVTKTGGALFYTRIIVQFKLISVQDGSSEVVTVAGEAMDSADKSSNKAQSAAYKYAAMQVFCIPTEGDNDADASHHEIEPRAKQGSKPSTVSARPSAAVSAAKAAIAMCDSLDCLTNWSTDNKTALDAMSETERNLIRKAFADQRARLKAKPAAPAQEPTPFDDAIEALQNEAAQ